eukprot:TRINITY_DN6303_c0_g3_i1.p1 TRINITY_DN6303_c0_g3~~TRINITY_DN6303_c0_g3_i1.p1  ORF type:complete len:1658 (+),score=478.92 TRINITY_DN6303_c0_g3_i1:53-5026(+)
MRAAKQRWGSGDDDPNPIKALKRPWSAQPVRDASSRPSRRGDSPAPAWSAQKQRPSSAGLRRPDSAAAVSARRSLPGHGTRVPRSLLADDDRKQLEAAVRGGLADIMRSAHSAHGVVEAVVLGDTDASDDDRQRLIAAERGVLNAVKTGPDTGLVDGVRPVTRALLDSVGLLSAKARSIARVLYLRTARDHIKNPELRTLPDSWSAETIIDAADGVAGMAQRTDCPDCFREGTGLCDLGPVFQQMGDLVQHLLSILKSAHVGVLTRENRSLQRQVAQLQADVKAQKQEAAVAAVPEESAALSPRQLERLASQTGLEEMRGQIDSVRVKAESTAFMTSAELRQLGSTMSFQQLSASLQSMDGGDPPPPEYTHEDPLVHMQGILRDQNRLMQSLYAHCLQEGVKETIAKKRFKALEATIVDFHQQLVMNTARADREADAKQAEINRLMIENQRLRDQAAQAVPESPIAVCGPGCGARTEASLQMAVHVLRSDVRSLEARMRNEVAAASKQQLRIRALESELEVLKDKPPPPPPPLTVAELSTVLAADKPEGLTTALRSMGGVRWPPPLAPLPRCGCPQRVLLSRGGSRWPEMWRRACTLPVVTDDDLNMKMAALQSLWDRFRDAAVPHIQRCCENLFSKAASEEVIEDDGVVRRVWIAELSASITILPPPEVSVHGAHGGVSHRSRRKSSVLQSLTVPQHPLPVCELWFARRKTMTARRRAGDALQSVLQGVTNFGGSTRAQKAIDRLAVPLTVHVDYLGCRCVAQVLPLAPATGRRLVYGSDRDPQAFTGRRYLTEPVAEDAMREVLTWLNVAPVLVPEPGDKPAKKFWGSPGIEIEQTADGDMLVTDPGTLCSSVSFRGHSGPEEYMRTDYARSLPQPLPATILTDEDPAWAAVEDAGVALWDDLAPKAARALVARYPSLAKTHTHKIEEEDFAGYDLKKVAECMHQWGVNVRCIGLLVSRLTVEAGDTTGSILVRTEMVARILKTTVWADVSHVLRSLDRNGSMSSLLASISDHLRFVLCTTSEATDYWERVIGVMAERKFGYLGGASRPVTPESVPLLLLFRRVCELCGLQPAANSLESLSSPSSSEASVRRRSGASGGAARIARELQRASESELLVTGVLPLVKAHGEFGASPHPTLASAGQLARAGQYEDAAREVERVAAGGASGDDAERLAVRWRGGMCIPVLSLLHRVAVPQSHRENEERSLMRVIDAIKADKHDGYHPHGSRSHQYLMWVVEMGLFFLSWHRPADAVPFFQRAQALLSGPLRDGHAHGTSTEVLAASALCAAHQTDDSSYVVLADALSGALVPVHVAWEARLAEVCRAVTLVVADGAMANCHAALCRACLQLLAAESVPADDPWVVRTLLTAAEAGAPAARAALPAIVAWASRSTARLDVPPGVYPVKPGADQVVVVEGEALLRARLVTGVELLHQGVLERQTGELLVGADRELERRFGSGSVRRTETQDCLAVFYRMSGSNAASVQCSSTCLELALSRYPPEHPARAVAMLEHGEGLAAAGHFANASDVLTRWAQATFSHTGVLPRLCSSQWVRHSDPETHVNALLLLASIAYPHWYTEMLQRGAAPEVLRRLLSAAERDASRAVETCEAAGFEPDSAVHRRATTAVASIRKAQRGQTAAPKGVCAPTSTLGIRNRGPQ